MAKQGCLSLHAITAASKTHCYIYLKACQVFALILAYLQEGMRMGSQDKDKGAVWKLIEKINRVQKRERSGR